MTNSKIQASNSYEWNFLNGLLPDGSFNYSCLDSNGDLFVAVNVIIDNIRKCFLLKDNKSEGKWDTIGGSFDGNIYNMLIDSNDNIYLAGTICDVNGNIIIQCYNTKTKTWFNYPTISVDSKMGINIQGIAVGMNNQLFLVGNIKDDGQYYVYEYNPFELSWNKFGKGFDDPILGVFVNNKTCLMVQSANEQRIPFLAIAYSHTDWCIIKSQNSMSFGTVCTSAESDFIITLTDGANAYVAIVTPETSYENGTYTVSYLINQLKSSISLNGGTGIFSLLVDSNKNIYAGGDFTDENNLCYVAQSDYEGSPWNNIGGSTPQTQIKAEENCIFGINHSSQQNIFYVSGRFNFVNYGKSN